MNPVDNVIQQAASTLRAGRLLDTEKICRSGLQTAPDDESLLLLLAISLHSQDRPQETLAVYQRLAALYPDRSAHWSNLGNGLRESRRHAEAEAAYRKALELEPRDALVHVNLGFLKVDMSDTAAARHHFLDGHDFDPGNVDACIYGAIACYECGDTRNAERLLLRRAHWAELSIDQMIDLGWALTQLSHADEGERWLQQAKTRDPGNLIVRCRLALGYERVNRLDEAQQMAAGLPDPERLPDGELRREIMNVQASLAMRDKDLPQARRLLERLSAASDNHSVRSNVFFALAKVCDKQGDLPAAIQALATAHAEQLRVASAIVPELLAPGMEPLKSAALSIDAGQFRRWPTLAAPTTAQSPIFIVGFPRSGTTLLEQMLDAHPGLRSMDERAFLSNLVEQMESFGLSYPAQLHQLSQEQCEQMRQHYWQQVAGVVELTAGQRLVDKNPLNLLRLPLIYRLFPNAHIILALRHPCDVILSNYMQNFRSPAFMVLCSTLDRLAHGYVNAMRFWIEHEALLQPKVFPLHYERMLSDFDQHVQAIGDFLELEDTSPLRDFQNHARRKGFISTPSYAQVVEPINSNAVGRWRRYAALFEPVLPILQPIMEHWRYEA